MHLSFLFISRPTISISLCQALSLLREACMKQTGRKKEEIVYYKPIVPLAQMMEVQAIPHTVTQATVTLQTIFCRPSTVTVSGRPCTVAGNLRKSKEINLDVAYEYMYYGKYAHIGIILCSLICHIVASFCSLFTFCPPGRKLIHVAFPVRRGRRPNL